MASSPYQVLGVAEGTSKSEAKKAYRKLLAHWHPDRHDGDPAAVKRFQDIKYAWDCIENNRTHAWSSTGASEVRSTDPVPQKTSEGFPWPRSEYIQHKINHGTSHERGMVAAASSTAAYGYMTTLFANGFGMGLLALGSSIGWMVASPGVFPVLAIGGVLLLIRRTWRSFQETGRNWSQGV